MCYLYLAHSVLLLITEQIPVFAYLHEVQDTGQEHAEDTVVALLPVQPHVLMSCRFFL